MCKSHLGGRKHESRWRCKQPLPVERLTRDTHLTDTLAWV